MKIRRSGRQAALTLAVVILPLVLGCGDDDGTGTNENPLVGTWSATSVLVGGVEVVDGTGFSITVTLRSDLTMSASYSGNTSPIWCGGASSCTENGTYTYTSTVLTICDPGCEDPAQYTISGSTLTYTLDVVVFTFVKT